MKLNEKLIKYLNDQVFPEYQKNETGHNLDHINYVIERSLLFADQVENINYDMVYTIAVYHDIGHHIDAKNHEKVSGEILRQDKKLREFFTEEEIEIMAEAVEDHRSSHEQEPRSIYGKIVSSADNNTKIEEPLKRTYSYRAKHSPNASLEEIIEESRQHIIEKFVDPGYAKEKMYFKDEAYENYLKECASLTSDRPRFIKRYLEVNGITALYLKELISNYEPYNEQEIKDKIQFLKFIDSFDDVVTRKNIFGHLTSSAFVVDEDYQKALLVHHNILGGFIYPGGHADGEYDLLSVAIREVMEETGIEVTPVTSEIFAIQSAPTKGHVKKGKYISTHNHYDVLYLLQAKNEDIEKVHVLESENSQVKWFDLDDTYNEEVIDGVRPINKKIVSKIRSLKK